MGCDLIVNDALHTYNIIWIFSICVSSRTLISPEHFVHKETTVCTEDDFSSLINMHPSISHRHTENLITTGLDIIHYRGAKNETGTLSPLSDRVTDEAAVGEG